MSQANTTTTTTTTISYPLRRSTRVRSTVLPPPMYTNSQTTHKTWDEMLAELAEFQSRTGHCKVPTSFNDNPRLGNWVHQQRIQYHRRRHNKSTTMTTARIRALNELGFIWTAEQIDDESWIKKYRELIEFSRREGHCRVPRGYRANPSLADWVASQRKAHRKEGSRVITGERRRLLNEIGFDWAPKLTDDEAWNDRYESLKAFKVEEGHCNVPRSEPVLGMWVKTQRATYKKFKDGKHSCITEERIEALERIGFQWSIRGNDDAVKVKIARPRADETWNIRYENLKAFKVEEGHCNVPRSEPVLGPWVKAQRAMYKKLKCGEHSSLTEERIEALERIGFQWSIRGNDAVKIKVVRPADEETWNDRYENLKAFKVDEGHCNVPRSEPVLGPWVKTQRAMHKKLMDGEYSSLTEKRIEALEQIGFQWSIRHCNKNVADAKGSKDIGTKLWMIFYEQLKEFRSQEGHCNVPSDCENNANLFKWVQNQKNEYRNAINGRPSSLTKELCDLLEQINFTWQDHPVRKKNNKNNNMRWNKQYAILKEFKSREGHCLVPQNYKADPSLANWVKWQRSEYKKRQLGKSSNMTDDRLAQLESIGFVWNTSGNIGWEGRYEELKLYHASHGHCNVPRDYDHNPSLGTWVHAQRNAYRKLETLGESTILTKERLALLEELEFVFQPREKNRNDAWLKHYRRLKEFMETNGHCRVDKKENKRLVNWVNEQRTEFEKMVKGRRSEMTKEKIKALKKIGFAWNMRAP